MLRGFRLDLWSGGFEDLLFLGQALQPEVLQPGIGFVDRLLRILEADGLTAQVEGEIKFVGDLSVISGDKRRGELRYAPVVVMIEREEADGVAELFVLNFFLLFDHLLLPNGLHHFQLLDLSF